MSSSTANQPAIESRDTNTASPAPRPPPTPSSNPHPHRPRPRPPPYYRPQPYPFLLRPVHSNFDLNHFAHVFTAFKRRAALDILSEKMASGGGNKRGHRQGSNGPLPGQMGMQAFPGHPPYTSTSSHSHSQQPQGQDGLALLADTMMRSPSSYSASPPSSAGPISPHTSGFMSQSQQLQPGWQQSAGYGYPGQDLSFYPGSTSHPLNPPSSSHQHPSFAPEWQGSYAPSSMYPLGPDGYAGGQGMAISPQELQLNLQAQMMYLQWQQQQLQAAAGGSSMGGVGHGGPSTSQGFPAASPTSPSGGLSGGSESDQTDDKRRRNTEASARFRQKKKERVNNLSQTISELDKKAQTLEKEANNLRTENVWLKEMVIMKGRRNMELQGAGAGRSKGTSGDDSEGDESS